ncbi:hypothetical protein RCL_jg3613.t2 [Rhizophagus clarus]|uniref:ASX DEUBAD domain-containing protein n=1 Tax=Rhizophagus clarus TaxID=94130 RepID=A0A8H3M4Z8_9GLOM|nr:hypothetical protein RCL_jg3613.t2 [Rhizophagus clarus]
MPRKRISGSNTNSRSSASTSTPVRRSTRIKRDEPKDEQLSNNVQELSSENEETQSKLSLPKKRTKPISPASKSTRAKKARNEVGKQQQIEEKKIDESPENASQESVTIKGKNKVIDQSYEDASTIEFKNQITEKLSTTPLNTISKHDSSDVNTDKSDPLVQAKWELIKAQLFEVPKEPRPAYREYQTKLFTKHPWMKKKDVDYLQKIFTDPKSMLAKKQLKTLFNFHIYNNFSDDQKSRLLKLLPNCDLVPIASDNGDPIDTPRIEREYIAAGLDSYEPGISEPVNELDPKKTEVPKNWKNDDYEQEWGIGLSEKIGKKQIAGDSAQISLPEMTKAQIIRLDDTLKYKRQFKNVGITVLMDLKVVAINKSNGHLQLKLFKGEQNKIIDDIHNPTRLENEVLDFDGRIAKSSRPNGNAFKNFSIYLSLPTMLYVAT